MQIVPKIVAESEPVFQDASNHNANSCRKTAEKLLNMSLYQYFKMRPILMQIIAKKCFLTCVLYIIFNKGRVSAVLQPLTFVLFLTPQFPCRNCGEPTGRTGSVFPSSGSLVGLPFAWIAEIIRKICFEFPNWFRIF